MNIHLYTNVIKKYFYLLYPTQSLDIVIHMSDYQERSLSLKQNDVAATLAE